MKRPRHKASAKGEDTDALNAPRAGTLGEWAGRQREAREDVVSLGFSGSVTWSMQGCRSVHFVAAAIERGNQNA